MRPRHPLWVVIACALAAAVLAGCVAPASTPITTAPARPTDTVVYGVPTAPSQGSPAVPLATASPSARATSAAPEASQAAGGRLTILHTNDVRGYLDPCG